MSELSSRRGSDVPASRRSSASQHSAGADLVVTEMDDYFESTLARRTHAAIEEEDAMPHDATKVFLCVLSVFMCVLDLFVCGFDAFSLFLITSAIPLLGQDKGLIVQLLFLLVLFFFLSSSKTPSTLLADHFNL